MTVAYADLVTALPRPYVEHLTDTTQPHQPALRGEVLAAEMRHRSERVETMGEVRADLDAAAAELTVPQLGDGQRPAARHHRVAAPDTRPTPSDITLPDLTLRWDLLDTLLLPVAYVLAGSRAGSRRRTRGCVTRRGISYRREATR